ncbi:MAG: carboxypeptidase regulatory-like domain-containing protein [Pyrinomonadaceae bacterium]
MSFVLCFSAAVFGQRTTGNIEGTVKDPQGAVVPGVSITVTGVNVGFNRTVQSDNQGFYRLQQIPAGTYKISSATFKGFAAYSADNVAVTLEQTTTADIILGVSGSVNTVDVSADPLGVNVDTSDTKIQTNITSALINQIPKGTSFISLLKVSPATRIEPLSGQVQIDGASGSENSFVVDGQELTNFRTGTLNAVNNIPNALVQEIQVKSSGFEAEYGGASGGVISVQTKSGTDVWHGEFGTQIETSKLQPGNIFAPQVYQNSPTSPQYVFAIRSPRDQYVNTYPNRNFQRTGD